MIILQGTRKGQGLGYAQLLPASRDNRLEDVQRLAASQVQERILPG